ncbi:MAG: SPOR domain-containing protein [Syntrophales bacterium]
MASDNTRHFELKLRKLGLFTLIFCMSALLFAAFLFGVVVGNDLETYPEMISRRLPVKFMQRLGFDDVEKIPPAVVIKTEKQPAKGIAKDSGTIPRHAAPAPVLPGDSASVHTVKDVLRDREQPEQKALPPVTLAGKGEDGAMGKAVSAKREEPADRRKAAGGEKDKYVVQVTSCRNRGIAEDVVKELGGIGFQARIVAVEIPDKGTWYRVLLPDFDDRGEAQVIADKVDRALRGNKSVVRIQR